MNEVIREIYATGAVLDEDGVSHALRSHVDAAEGEFLAGLVRDDPAILKTLEVGCAYGLSSLHICTALRGRAGARHTIVDPNQTTQWRSVGTANLGRAGIDFFTLIEQGSEIALPKLLEHDAGGLDLVFIDGWHTFDHTLLDLFYAVRLLKVGGLLVVDDCNWAGVARAVDYVSRYPCMEVFKQSVPAGRRKLATTVGGLVPRAVSRLLPRGLYDHVYSRMLYSSMVALRKTGEDRRSWTWYASF